MVNAKNWMWSSLGLAVVVGLCLGVIVDRLLLQPQTVFADASPQKAQTPMWFLCDDRGPLSIEDEPGYPRPFAKSLHRRLLSGLSEELALDAAQVARLEESLGENRHEAYEFWESSRYAYCDIRDAFRHDIRDLLDPRQKLRFDKMTAQIDARNLERAERLHASAQGREGRE